MADPLGFIFNNSPVIGVLIYCFIVSFFVNIFYRIMIKQNTARALKERVGELNKQRKEAMKAGNKDQVNKIQTEVLSENMRLMKMTSRPMLISFVIVIILLPVLASVYESHGDIHDNTGSIVVQGNNYTFTVNGTQITVNGLDEYNGICDEKCYEINGTVYEASRDRMNILFFNWDRAKLSAVVATMPIPLPLVDYNIGWLGWYIIVSIPAVIIIRRFMKIYV